MIYFAVVRFTDDDTDIIGITTDRDRADEILEFAQKQYNDVHDFSIFDYDDSFFELKPLWYTRYTRGKYTVQKAPSGWRMLYEDSKLLTKYSEACDNWSWQVYADSKEEALELFKQKLNSELSPWEKMRGKVKIE